MLRKILLSLWCCSSLSVTYAAISLDNTPLAVPEGIKPWALSFKTQIQSEKERHAICTALGKIGYNSADEELIKNEFQAYLLMDEAQESQLAAGVLPLKPGLKRAIGKFHPGLKTSFKCQNIPCIRKNIDKINSQIMRLLAKRTVYVRKAGLIKGPILSANDSKRVQEEMKKIAIIANNEHVPKSIALSTFNAIILSSIKYEQQYKDNYYHRVNK